MSDFSERLKNEIEYKGLLQKEVASKANIKKRALDMYVGSQKSMPPADIAVKLAQVLGVSVEYLVTGQDDKKNSSFNRKYSKLRDVLDDMIILSDEVLTPIKAMIHTAADEERKKHKKSDSANDRLA